jgi:MoxR-like ATPase
MATRQPEEFGLNDIKGLIQYGASPRASIYLALAAKGHAFIRRRGYVTPDDIKSIGMDVLRHRIILTYEAEAEEQSAETIIQKSKSIHARRSISFLPENTAVFSRDRAWSFTKFASMFLEMISV